MLLILMDALEPTFSKCTMTQKNVLINTIVSCVTISEFKNHLPIVHYSFLSSKIFHLAHLGPMLKPKALKTIDLAHLGPMLKPIALKTIHLAHLGPML